MANIVAAAWPGAPAPVRLLGSLAFPAVVTAPLAFPAIWLVSVRDGELPTNIGEIWVRIHGTARERSEARRRRAPENA